jgi:hypothetical protein
LENAGRAASQEKPQISSYTNNEQNPNSKNQYPERLSIQSNDSDNYDDLLHIEKDLVRTYGV